MGAPLLAQSVMLIAMASQRQWLVVSMLLPGMVACLASMLSALPSLGMTPDGDPTDMSADRLQQNDGTSLHDNEKALRSQCHTAQDRDTSRIGRLMHDIGTTTLESLLGWDRLAWRSIVRAWLDKPSLRVPVGLGSEGPFVIDLRSQGPHALVAGTTGSGKSVLLQSWCLALAAANGANRLNFVFLDFKGGSAFRQLEALPHTVGSVCDLDLKHAVRALAALERELRRREQLAADRHVANLDELEHPPPRLVVVVDEFHALKDQLPDYVGRLVRVASLGRSLGMHLIACTQNPLGQVSADMKANISLNLCLRVRDDMQSRELLGAPIAARIPPSLPGAVYCNDAEAVTPLRCSPPENIAQCCAAIRMAHTMMGLATPPPLFTAPLPSRLDAVRLAETIQSESDAKVDAIGASESDDCGEAPVGLADDGVRLFPATLPIGHGNIAVIGPDGRGKSTVLSCLAQHLPAMRYKVRSTRWSGRAYRTCDHHRPRQDLTTPYATHPPPAPPHMVWLVDDADRLFDPFHPDALSDTFRRALTDSNITVVFAVQSARHVRVPEHCATRIVFPCGERATDLASGIPAGVLSAFDAQDIATAGRAVLIRGGSAYPMQNAFVNL